MSTGDLQNNFKQLANELKKVKYGKKLDSDLIVSGSPKAYLPIYNFLFTSYNTRLNEDIVNSNNELYGKSDMRFMEAVYRIMRDMFDYKAKITRDQFFAPGFSEQKVIMAKEVLQLVRGRYNPPKNKRYHVTASRSTAKTADKVPQEPATGTVQQVSPNPQGQTNLTAGAIVLPSRPLSSGSATSSKHRPTSGQQSLKGPKHNQERPVFIENVRAVRSASPPSPGANSWRSNEHGQPAQQPLVVRATGSPGSSHFAPLPVHHELPYVTSAPREQRRFDTGKSLPIAHNDTDSFEDVEDEEVDMAVPVDPQPPRSEAQLSAALVNLLSQQMNDVIFKLQTLTSRITLLENRVTLVEAQLKDEKSQRMTLFASQSYNQAKRLNGGLTVGQVVADPVCVAGQSFPAQSTASNSDARGASRDKKAKPSDPVPSITLPPNEQNISVKNHSGSSRSSKDKVESSRGQLRTSKQEVNRPEEDMAVKSLALEFMKSLVSPEDCSSLLTTSGAEPPELSTAQETDNTTENNDSTLVEAAELFASEGAALRGTNGRQNASSTNDKADTDASSLPAQKTKSAKPPKGTKGKPPFSQDFSPIRPFSDLSSMCLNQDESASMMFAGAGEECSLVGRRSSTPSGVDEELDTSTLDRITRINQMMEATKQLLY